MIDNYTFFNYLIVSLFVFIAICFALLIFIAIKNQKKISQLQRSEEIQIGMPEREMLSIMGDGYTKSLLKNNRVKYEWRINGRSYGSSYNGVSVRSYSGVKKVGIYVKDGLVEEVRGFNLN